MIGGTSATVKRSKRVRRADQPHHRCDTEFESRDRGTHFKSAAQRENGQSEVSNVLIRGTVSDYLITSTFDFKEGRFFNDVESRSGANVCVIGYDVADALFPSETPIDKSVLINGQPFRVVGVISRQGTFLGLFSLDSIVVMPLPAFSKILQRQKRFRHSRKS